MGPYKLWAYRALISGFRDLSAKFLGFLKLAYLQAIKCEIFNMCILKSYY
jgi:hypothetical protein